MERKTGLSCSFAFNGTTVICFINFIYFANKSSPSAHSLSNAYRTPFCAFSSLFTNFFIFNKNGPAAIRTRARRGLGNRRSILLSYEASSKTIIPHTCLMFKNVPDGSQTRDLRLRRPTLYSTELQALTSSLYYNKTFLSSKKQKPAKGRTDFYLMCSNQNLVTCRLLPQVLQLKLFCHA